MKRKRLCDVVCRTFWEYPKLSKITVDTLQSSIVLFVINRCTNSNRSGSQIMSILSRTPGPLVKTTDGGIITIRPPWPTADRDAIVLSRDAIKSEADFDVLNSRRGSLIARTLRQGCDAWEARQLAWLESACEAWVEKTCPRRYPEVEVAV